jgi:hypothetical protein
MLAYNYVGRQHMMFGTDYPYTNHGPEHVEELPISAKDEAATRKRCSGWLERIKILVIASVPRQARDEGEAIQWLRQTGLLRRYASRNDVDGFEQLWASD